MDFELNFVIPGFYCENGKTLGTEGVTILEVLGEDPRRKNYFLVKDSNSLHENEILGNYYKVEIKPNSETNYGQKNKSFSLGDIENIAPINTEKENTFLEKEIFPDKYPPPVQLPNQKVFEKEHQISFEEQLINKLVNQQSEVVNKYNVEIVLPFDVISIATMLKQFNINEVDAISNLMKNENFKNAVVNSLLTIFDSDKIVLKEQVEIKKENNQDLVYNEETLKVLKNIDEKLDLIFNVDKKLDSIESLIIKDSFLNEFPDLPVTSQVKIGESKFSPIIEKYLNK